ncbi:MAG: preprotein translocase subunit SecG [Candidatus Omnitrophica bacterium]|nr:preprotein translocase subunit SecG [Candidatus Omnitrophota bacterium]
MNALVIAIHILVCFVLIIVILLQAGRGQGLTGSSFGGGNVQSLLGTKASSFLTKATTVCAILFLFTCIGLNVLEVRKSRSLFRSPQAQAPLDVNQIKKALEKLKTTEAASPASAEGAAASAANAATEATAVTANPAAATTAAPEAAPPAAQEAANS